MGSEMEDSFYPDKSAVTSSVAPLWPLHDGLANDQEATRLGARPASTRQTPQHVLQVRPRLDPQTLARRREAEAAPPPSGRLAATRRTASSLRPIAIRFISRSATLLSMAKKPASV